ncbi:sensor histidine kinase [Luteitalea sp.]|jgi:two-component system sensor histidine kinase BaeS|uniref:sensor histidine kinase n=1 Tax=Luteitalea sp. TaxID=2004800 RepID=UPI0037C87252
MRSLRVRLLLAVGLLVILAVVAVAVGARRDTHRELLEYDALLTDESREMMPFMIERVHARLDGVCCGEGVMDAAAARLPPRALVFVFDPDGEVIGKAGGALASLQDVHATVIHGRFAMTATRVAGARRERLAFELVSPGRLVRLADGRMGTIHALLVPEPGRQARVAATLGSLDQGLLLLTLTIGTCGLVLTWFIAHGALRPLAGLRAATAALGDGAFDRRVPVQGPSEVADLAVDFNRLAARLQDQHALRQAMTNDVAHELRTPLTAMRCRLESVRDGVSADPTRTCEALYDDVLHLTRLVDDLQDIALAESRELRLSRRPLRLRDEVDGALATLGLDGAPRVHVDVPTALVVDADSTRLRQVLVNLLGNARRHAPEDADIRGRAHAEGAEVVVEVENDGSHIPPDHLARVFERFWRVDAARDRDSGGSGLGLAIVKHLVEAHGGRVSARSSATTVTMSFTLPVASTTT